MAFIDKKERIIDITLTEKGRELLAKNQFQVQFYAFSDEGLDYSGSLFATNPNNGITTEGLDDYIIRSFIPIEAESFGATKISGIEVRDLKSFLITSADSNTVPEFKLDNEGDADIILHRTYKEKEIYQFSRENMVENDNVEFVIKADSNKTVNLDNRSEEYAQQQRIVELANSIL